MERRASLLGLDTERKPAKVMLTDEGGNVLPVMGGVLMVPASISNDEWYAAVQKQQAELLAMDPDTVLTIPADDASAPAES